jgi:undecaprenyl-diphosphatase
MGWIGVAVLQFLVVGALYAIGEALPIGAAAQFAWIEGWGDVLGLKEVQNTLGMSLGCHLGLALATALYFWRDIGDMVQGLIKMAKGKRDPNARLFFQLIAATAPMVAAAVGIQRLDAPPWLSPMVLAWVALAFSLLLLLFDRACMTVKRIEHAGYGDVILLGIVQALSIVPGVGRLAVVIALARLLGYERRDAARFAFLISIPTLFAACAWNGYGMVLAGQGFSAKTVLSAALVTLLVALPLIGMLMNWVRRATFATFAVYRLLISANLLAFAYNLF